MTKNCLSVAMALLLTFLLAACSQDSDPGAKTTPPTDNPSTAGTDTTDLSGDDGRDPDGDQAPLLLRYMAWDMGTEEENNGLGNVNRQMIEAFMDRYPHVTVEIVTVPLNADGTDGNYGDYLNTLAAQQNLPDVFMWTSVTDTVARGWLSDVSEYALGDQDYLNVTQAMREGGQVNGHVYGIPYAMFLQGMAVNFDIFDELNVPYLPFSYSLEEMRQAMANTTSASTRGSDNLNIQDWGTFVLSDDLGFFAFDGASYQFTRPEFAASVDFFRDLVARGHTGHGDFVEPWAPEGSWPWGDGYIALQLEASWALPGFVNGERPFKADLMPLPNEKAIIIPDFIFIGANTQHPEWAYELAKWMSYGHDGQMTRLDIIPRTEGAGYPGIPLMAGHISAVDDFFLENYRPLENFIRLYGMLATHPQNFVMEPLKVIPGYTQSRFEGDTGVIGTVDGEERSLSVDQLLTSILRGERQLADYAAELSRISTAEFERASAQLSEY